MKLWDEGKDILAEELAKAEQNPEELPEDISSLKDQDDANGS